MGLVMLFDARPELEMRLLTRTLQAVADFVSHQSQTQQEAGSCRAPERAAGARRRAASVTAPATGLLDHAVR